MTSTPSVPVAFGVVRFNAAVGGSCGSVVELNAVEVGTMVEVGRAEDEGQNCDELAMCERTEGRGSWAVGS